LNSPTQTTFGIMPMKNIFLQFSGVIVIRTTGSLNLVATWSSLPVSN